MQRLRFATRDELAALTGLAPGCVPPFGRPVFDLPLFVDPFTLEPPSIAFSPGRHDRLIVMPTERWVTVARPAEVLRFALPPDTAHGGEYERAPAVG